MVSLLFGFPLLTAYYNVNAQFYFLVTIPYLVITIGIALFMIVRSQTLGAIPPPKKEGKKSNFMATFNSIPYYVALSLVTLAVVMYSLLRYLVLSTYPFPAPAIVNPLGQAYLVVLAVASVIGFSKILYHISPVLREIFREKKYALMAVVISVSFWLVYTLLVNQLIVVGFNAVGTVPPPGGNYPFSFAMVPGVRAPFIDLVYLPIVIVQFDAQVNMILVPFEMVFATLLSLLVAANVSAAHYLISNSGLRCSTKGTVISTSGSILGLTATCPTCLAPTFISVIFGGITAAEAAYSNVYGVVLPPVLSLATLLLSLLYLTRTLKKQRLVSMNTRLSK